MNLFSAEQGMHTMRAGATASLITDQARLQARAGVLSQLRLAGGLPSLTPVHHTDTSCTPRQYCASLGH